MNAAARARTGVEAGSNQPLLVAEELTKRFPGVLAVDAVDLTIDAGEILALLGQNGAGKSTLIQILSGVHPSGTYEGRIALDGRPFLASSVREAERGGVALLAQEVSVAPDLSIAETVFLNDEPTRWGLIDVPLRLARTRALLADFGMDLDAGSRMGALDLVSQQLVLIVRALSKDARLLILDEPTAALTDREVSRLFDRLRHLAKRGVAIIFVSHRLQEVFAISDRIVVMRDGRICGEHLTKETSRDHIVGEMVGRTIASAGARTPSRAGGVALEVRGLTLRGADGDGGALVDGLDIRVGKGEIVGLYGLLGSGCIEAVMAMFGAATERRSGEIRIDGRAVEIRSPRDAVRNGVGLVAQDRRDGLCGEHSLLQNMVLADLDGISCWGVLDVSKARRLGHDLAARLAIKAPSIDAEVGTLSGGNQQKVQVARWLAAEADLLLLVDPTRGVDVGARAEIKRIWMDLRKEGCAILLVSSDTEEMVELCDRVTVLQAGRVVGQLDRAELSERSLLRLATGG